MTNDTWQRKHCENCAHWTQAREKDRPWGWKGGHCAELKLMTHCSNLCDPKRWRKRQ